MRSLLIFSFIVTLAVSSMAQKRLTDMVYLKNGDRISGLIISEIPKISITIQSNELGIMIYNYEDIYLIRRKDINKHNEKFLDSRRNKYLSLGLGYGSSYGGAGFRFLQRIGGITGFAYHFGIGLNRNFSNLAENRKAPRKNIGILAGGVKFFFYKHFYAGISVGFTFIEGPEIARTAFSLGADWVFYKNFGLNAAIGTMDKSGSALITEPSNLIFDIGVFYKFGKD